MSDVIQLSGMFGPAQQPGTNNTTADARDLYVVTLDQPHQVGADIVVRKIFVNAAETFRQTEFLELSGQHVSVEVAPGNFDTARYGGRVYGNPSKIVACPK